MRTLQELLTDSGLDQVVILICFTLMVELIEAQQSSRRKKVLAQSIERHIVEVFGIPMEQTQNLIFCLRKPFNPYFLSSEHFFFTPSLVILAFFVCMSCLMMTVHGHILPQREDNSLKFFGEALSSPESNSEVFPRTFYNHRYGFPS
ncbi:hypothetical protein CEB3_c12900 [Peptococcaceae bacterium CEB3]|nr:hypothetical protein CEB3_c12900 [Peptococcaceae bacterium CEB3]